MLLSINQLSQLTGRDRKTFTKQLENLPFIDGEKALTLRIERSAPVGLRCR